VKAKALAAILLALCSVWALGRRADAQAPPQAAVQLVRHRRQADVYQVTFPSPVQNAVPPNPTVYVEYWVPRAAGPMPAVILLHHWGVVRPIVERELAAVLAENGVITAMLTLPYHLQRTPPRLESGQAFISADVARIVRSVEQTVLEVGSLLNWLRSRPEVDSRRIGLAGVSLGAIIGALALGEIDQFAATVLILGGGNVADIFWRSPITLKIRPGLRRLGYTEERLRAALASVEPLSHLSPALGRRVLMINAIHDPVIPRRDALALWDALGRPPIIWVESGHFILRPGRTVVDRLAADFFLYQFGERASFNPPAVVRLRRVKLGVLLDRAPLVGIGGAAELLRPPSGRVSLDLNLTTGGASIGGAINVSTYLAIGLQRKLFSSERRLLPYAMVYFTL